MKNLIVFLGLLTSIFHAADTLGDTLTTFRDGRAVTCALYDTHRGCGLDCWKKDTSANVNYLISDVTIVNTSYETVKRRVVDGNKICYTLDGHRCGDVACISL